MATIKELEDFKIGDAVKFNDELNPVLWEDEKLRPEIRKQLLKIAENFAEYLGLEDLKIEDITISGSNAAYTWTSHSDIDLHLLVDFSNLPDDEVYQELFTAKKTIYNDTHSITIKKLPVELYVQDTTQKHHSMGTYSIINDEWISIPKKEKPNFDEAATKLKYEKLGDMIELALKTKDLEKVKSVLSLIRRYRKSGLDKTGEFGPENLAFKAVRKQGLVQRLYDLKDELESKDLSIDEQITEDTGFRYYKNPTPKQLYRLTEKSKHKHMRGIYHNGKTYWWDATDAIHKIGAEELGLPYNYLNRMEAAIGVASGKYTVAGDENVPNELLYKYDLDNEIVLDSAKEQPKSRNMLDKPTLTVDQLAKKHRVSSTEIVKQLDKGIRVELEHTNDRKVAREIALDHLSEDPAYYDKLAKAQLEEASGYIPSEKEKNDPRFKTALTVDVKPDAIRKNAKAFNWKTTRAGLPPVLKTNGKTK